MTSSWEFLICFSWFIVGSHFSSAVEVNMEGNGYITLDLRSDNIATTKDDITFSFKTFQASGLLLHSSGSQGDYINIELVHGRIRWELNELGNLSPHGFEISYHLGHSLILSSARATKTKIRPKTDSL